jgi:hypothetical protein
VKYGDALMKASAEIRLEPPPGPEADETPAVLAVEPRSAGETAYIAKLFDYRSVRGSW